MVTVAYRVYALLGTAGSIALALFAFAATPVSAADEPRTIAIAGFSYKDTSGEVRDQSEEHRARLKMLSEMLRANLASGGKFTVVNIECDKAECAVEDGIAPPAFVEIAAQAGAHYLVAGGVQKMSTLVQWARVVVLDLKQRKVVLDRLYSFRGDTEDAWRHAAEFASRYINDLPLED